MQSFLLENINLNISSINDNLNNTSVKFNYKQGRLIEISRWRAVIITPFTFPKPKDAAFLWLSHQVQELTRIRGKLKKEEGGRLFFTDKGNKVNIDKKQDQKILEELVLKLDGLKEAIAGSPKKLCKRLDPSEVLDNLNQELNKWEQEFLN